MSIEQIWMKETQGRLSSWLKEHNMVALKKEYLSEHKKEIEMDLLQCWKEVVDDEQNDRPAWRRHYIWSRHIRPLEKELKRVNWRMQTAHNDQQSAKNQVTNEMIARAKEHPWENLIQINKASMAHCPFHGEDKHPSLYVKKGYAFCFVEQRSWDTIAFVIDQEHLSFKQAVLRLQ